jgi:NADP-dependent 3-hydroxy acid dehydrogenase YdfG
MGRAIALAAADAGAHVVLAARRGDLLEETRATIVQSGGAATAIATDVTDPAAVAHLVEAAHAVSGHIRVLVHAAGINIRERALDDLTPQRWSHLVETNLSSAFYLTHTITPIFRAQGDGLIIYIASSAAKKPDRSGVSYQASKAGLVGLAHGTMEEERASGLRTTVIFPGLTDTPLVLQRPTPTPPDVLARALQPEDIAAACMFVMGLPPRAHVPELVLYPSQV